jgi:hypothetical protein
MNMIITLFLVLFSFNSFADNGQLGTGILDPDDPPINELVKAYSRGDIRAFSMGGSSGTPENFLEKIFSKGQIGFGYGDDKQTFNLTYTQQKEFMKKYLLKIAVKSSRVSSTDFQSKVKELAQSKYATEINYKIINRVEKLSENGLLGTEVYQTLMDEGHDKDEIKSMIQNDVNTLSWFSKDDINGRDDLINFMLKNKLEDENFITEQFEKILADDYSYSREFGNGEPLEGGEIYSESLKKIAEFYDPNASHPTYGGGLLCRLLADTSATVRTPVSDKVLAHNLHDDIYKSFGNLSNVVGAMTYFNKDLTNNNEKCFGQTTIAEYLEELGNHPLFNHDDPNLKMWRDVIIKDGAIGCGEKVGGIVPSDLCQRDILLEEATDYLKSIKRVGDDVEHVYAHQVNNCLLVLFATLSSNTSADLSKDDFRMEIKYLEPRGNDRIFDEIKETRNFKLFQIKMQSRRDMARKLKKIKQ